MMRILITAGPTREYFDTVRFISNPSSGKMGYAIAAAALERGHQVVLVSGPVALPDPKDAEVIRVTSAREMLEACISALDPCDAVIMTAAVCDYRPSRQLAHKLKKHHRVRPIHLQPTEDILTHLARAKGERVTIGFAMEDRDHHANTEAKLKSKGCDAFVLNGIENVGSDEATIEILRADRGWSPAICGTKKKIAESIVDLVESLASKDT